MSIIDKINQKTPSADRGSFGQAWTISSIYEYPILSRGYDLTMTSRTSGRTHSNFPILTSLTR